MSDQTRNIVEFTLIYNQHKTKLYNYARKMIYDRMVCEDIIQNTFIKFFENMEKIRNSESIQSWLFTTVRNHVFTYFRNKKIHVDQFYVDDADEVDIKCDENFSMDYERKEIRELINAELDKMALEQRDVFLLKEYGGFSYKEIASMMMIDEGLVKSRLFKTRQRLIRKLSKVLQNY